MTDFPTEGDDLKVSLRNSNWPQFDFQYAENLKEEHPDIWRAGGNIRGNEAYLLWEKARDGAETEGVLLFHLGKEEVLLGIMQKRAKELISGLPPHMGRGATSWNFVHATLKCTGAVPFRNSASRSVVFGMGSDFESRGAGPVKV